MIGIDQFAAAIKRQRTDSLQELVFGRVVNFSEARSQNVLPEVAGWLFKEDIGSAWNIDHLSFEVLVACESLQWLDQNVKNYRWHSAQQSLKEATQNFSRKAKAHRTPPKLYVVTRVFSRSDALLFKLNCNVTVVREAYEFRVPAVGTVQG